MPPFIPEKYQGLTKKILSIAFPIMVQNIAFYIMMFTNTVFIGHYKLEGLSAIQNVMIPFNMIMSFFMALTQGTTIIVSQALGAGEYEKARKAAESSFFYNQIFSIGLFFFWLFLGKYILYLMGARDDILEMGARYVQILSSVYLTMGLGNTSSAVFQGIGKTKPIMISSITRSILNVFLDYTFIFGHFGMPELGVSGAALSTVISITLGNLFLYLIVLRNEAVPIRLKSIIKPEKKIYGRVFNLGFQAGLEFMLWSGSQVVLVAMLNSIDKMSAGYYGMMNLLIQMTVNLYWGIGLAVISLVGKATGAKDPGESRQIGNISLVFAVSVCIIIGIVFHFLPKELLSLFTNNKEVIDYLLPVMLIISLLIFPKAVNIISGQAIRGMGDTRWMLFTQIIGTVLIISLSAFFIFILRTGFAGIMIANFADESWRAVVNYLRFHFKLKKAVLAGL